MAEVHPMVSTSFVFAPLTAGISSIGLVGSTPKMYNAGKTRPY